ncbi:piggyBac transposable element-derived protein 4 [Trichonephila inaurata madagascariensis]|uniref:PiggyBac transposable element-derived protein 4 n=1 Tax=Trichonephila inaurata madagascariensis TaxID=2747483 RepID=A0A8X6YUR6_9ARAC|nr:piggyBac transposable element-derived protein 4 [Trichonephila inaurata madagascariensis]
MGRNEYYSRCETFPQSSLTSWTRPDSFFCIMLQTNPTREIYISSSEDDSSDEEDFSSVRQWCKIDSSSPAPSRFNFIGDVGMKACVTNISDPLEYFELYFTDEIVNHIVTETNIFAAENLNKFKSKEHSRIHHWSETNANELRVFFAILILQGIITKPTGDFLGPNTYHLKGPDLVSKCLLCESHSGYVWSIIIYVDKGKDVSEENKECSFSTQVVLTLSKPLLNKGYCLTMDNYYNSPELGEMLLKSKTDFFGTLRPNRKDLPKELKAEKLKKGDLLAYQRGKNMTMRWREKKYVHFISSIHNPEIVCPK